MKNELKMFKDIVFKDYNFIRRKEVLLETRFPILFSFEAANKSFLVYVVKLKKRKKIVDLLVSETTPEILLQLATQVLSIKDAIEFYGENRIRRIAYSEDKQLTDKEIIPYQEIFEEDIKLDYLIPNKIDLDLVKEKLLLNIKNNKHIESKYINGRKHRLDNSINSSYIFSETKKIDLLKSIYYKRDKIEKETFNDSLVMDYYERISKLYNNTENYREE